MPKRFEDPILVPTAVLDGLETVRESSDTNMQDHSGVKAAAARLGYPETAAWIEDHPEDYAEGVFRGFVGNRNSGSRPRPARVRRKPLRGAGRCRRTPGAARRRFRDGLRR